MNSSRRKLNDANLSHRLQRWYSPTHWAIGVTKPSHYCTLYTANILFFVWTALTCQVNKSFFVKKTSEKTTFPSAKGRKKNIVNDTCGELAIASLRASPPRNRFRGLVTCFCWHYNPKTSATTNKSSGLMRHLSQCESFRSQFRNFKGFPTRGLVQHNM